MIWFLLSTFLGILGAAPKPAPARARLPQMPPRRAPRRRTFEG